jgi:hypothetical protein
MERRVKLTDRRRRLLSMSRTCGDVRFDAELHICLIPRETAWYAIALLCSEHADDAALGMQLLETLHTADVTHTPATFLAILHCPMLTLTARAEQNLRDQIGDCLIPAALVEWHDGNVNHPLAAWATLILGGELCGRDWAVELGVRRLHAFRSVIGDRKDSLHRQAEMSEYNSPTYTALDLWFLAIVAEHAADARARRIALFLEQRLWLDVALHYHASSGQFAGPHSRSYMDDSFGGYSPLHCTLYAASDLPVYLNPSLADRFEHPSNLIQNSLIAIIPFHMPEDAIRMAAEKSFPFGWERMTYGESYHENSAASGFDHEVFTGGWSELRTYMTAEYALGTASRPYVNAGHSDSFMLRLRSSETVAGMGDFRSVFTRGVFDGAEPGRSNRCRVTGGAIDASFLYEESRTAIFQHEHSAILFATPKRQGEGVIDSFRLDILITNSRPPDLFLADGAPVGELPASYRAGTRFVIRDYRTWICIIPLTPDPAVVPEPIEVRGRGEFLLLSIWNHRGAPLAVSRDELCRWRNGFVVELGTMNEYPTLENFLAHVEHLRVSEEVTARGERRVTVVAGNRRMSFAYDPVADRIVSRQLNGNECMVQHFSMDAVGGNFRRSCPGTLFGTEEWSRHGVSQE